MPTDEEDLAMEAADDDPDVTVGRGLAVRPQPGAAAVMVDVSDRLGSFGGSAVEDAFVFEVTGDVPPKPPFRLRAARPVPRRPSNTVPWLFALSSVVGLAGGVFIVIVCFAILELLLARMATPTPRFAPATAPVPMAPATEPVPIAPATPPAPATPAP